MTMDESESVYNMDMLEKGMIYNQDRTEYDGRFHHPTQNTAQFKMCELFIFMIFHLMWPALTKGS